jgi:hypothetical protein
VAYGDMKGGYKPHKTRRLTTKTSRTPQNMSGKFNP